MFTARDTVIYKKAVKTFVQYSQRGKCGLEGLLAGLGSLIEKHFSDVRIFSWTVVGNAPSAVYPEGNGDDLYIDEIISNPDIPFGSRGFFGDKRRVYYSMFGRSERYFAAVAEFSADVPEKRKNGVILTVNDLFSLAAPLLSEIFEEERVSVIRDSCDWSAVPFTLATKEAGLVAFVRLNGFDRIVTEKGYETAMEIYSGWITAAGKHFEDAVYSMDSDSLVIIQTGKASLEKLADFQNEIDAIAASESLRSTVVYRTAGRCTYADVAACRRMIIEAGPEGNGLPPRPSGSLPEAGSSTGAGVAGL